MTREDIVRMAKEAGMDYLQYISPEAFEKVEAFAKLVAQHEREACAKIVDAWSDWHGGTEILATAIRARSKE
jgi:tRNA(Leu) C34 or U34 (ribose-2'-O)-methylase TrmL